MKLIFDPIDGAIISSSEFGSLRYASRDFSSRIEK